MTGFLLFFLFSLPGALLDPDNLTYNGKARGHPSQRALQAGSSAASALCVVRSVRPRKVHAPACSLESCCLPPSQVAICLLPPTAFAFGFRIVNAAEGAVRPLGWGDAGRTDYALGLSLNTVFGAPRATHR